LEYFLLPPVSAFFEGITGPKITRGVKFGITVFAFIATMLLDMSNSGHELQESPLSHGKNDQTEPDTSSVHNKITEDLLPIADKVSEQTRRQIDEQPPGDAKVQMSKEEMREKVRELYNSLLKFKDYENFHYYGFAIAGPYNQWLLDTKAIRETTGAEQLFFEDQFVVGDLLTLGLEYNSSGGKETEFSLYAKSELRKGLKKKLTPQTSRRYTAK
jgi:hypothetical protein